MKNEELYQIAKAFCPLLQLPINPSRIFITISVGGEPTDDKPTVTLEPPSDPHHASSFLNIRVADINDTYERWRARGAQFLTPPIDRGNEIRCYIRDPDGHLIEVGQLVGRVEGGSRKSPL